jgi:uncharacterized membrane protein YfcA
MNADDLLLHPVVLHVLIFLGAFIDSIAGGGGLITLPVHSILLGPNVQAIATNKMVAFASAATALFVYSKKSKLLWRPAIPFIAGIFSGTVIGSLAASSFTVVHFQLLMILICPVILIVTLKRDSFLTRSFTQQKERKPAQPMFLAGMGILIGIYDGCFGPGGGTFMFLALLLSGSFYVVEALAISKLANSISAGTALTNFAIHGHVQWSVGGPLVVTALIAALIGSKFASEKAKTMVRPALIVVVCLLLYKIASQWIGEHGS